MATTKTKAKPKAKTTWVVLRTAVNGEYSGGNGDIIEMDNATAKRFIDNGFADQSTKPAGAK